MDEFQSPKATRKYPIQRNLAEQPDVLDDLADDLADQPAAGDSTIVDIPGRSPQLDQISPAPLSSRRSSTKRKTSSAAKRKSQPTAVQKTQPSFRQFQEMQQPFAEELRRLEAQAERINQLLVERANRRMQFEQAVEQVTRTPEPPIANRRSPRPAASTSPHPPQSDDTETLKAQAERIKQRLAELEAAMQEAASSLNQYPEAEEEVEEDWQLPILEDTLPAASVPPHQALDRSHPEPTSEGSRPPQFSERDGSRVTRPSQRSTAKRSVPLPQIFELPKKPLDRIGDAAVWIAVATAIRLSSQPLIVSYPVLAPVVTLLMLAPAAIAVYLAVFVPQAGSVSIYRLFLIMLGFLLGGRL
ncbi:hypothetical protein [Pantanalinema sp. GBBB05]|uniref:hypothetical protein n=1 Tax=Pantanalinema sp. GBBB05 TaxID=2604139 RepID=UPI001D674D8E|nr:hypothetical protein [Pantanalinema sp. GBBB05]